MPAGTSAGQESRRQLSLAVEHEHAALEARAAAGRYGVAEVTEKRVAQILSPLSAIGYHLLPDRGWPGTRRAQVDLIVVGPGGLFIVDTKAWNDVTILGDRIFRGQADVSDDLAGLADLAYGTEAAMADLGLAPGEVHPVVVLAGHRGIKAMVGTVEVVGELDALAHITSRGTRLTSRQVDAVLAASLGYFPVLGAPAPVDATVREPVLAPEPAVIDAGELLTIDEVNDALVLGVMAAPIEEWMSFLHPEQARLVRRSFNGPSRIRGAAGTGKTVVGLHRAAYLARSRPGTVLVTTFVSTLPAVLSSLMSHMAPEVSDRVEFVGAHAFAKRLLADRGVRVNLQPRISDAEYTAAWQALGQPGILGQLDSNSGYWHDEIDSVIKGRGITTFEQYADLQRTGRRRRLSVDQRRAVWDLHLAYDEALRARGVHDFADLILLAEASLRADPVTRYSAVIVDEAQDLSCSMIRMLYLLVGNKPDGLTLIGDGQQSIYPGGYTLAEVGISLAGRGVVMDTNYRNTAQIVEFAASMVLGDEFIDIEGTAGHCDATKEIPRTGPPPVVSQYPHRSDYEAALVSRVREVTGSVGTEIGDVGVLALNSFEVRKTLAALRRAGIPVTELYSYDGRPVNAVKVGTVKRAKGLEFKQVLMANVPSSLLAARAPISSSDTRPDDTALERWELQRRELYVAMTRARDGLWLGTVG